MMENKKYMVLSFHGSPLARKMSQEVNPFIWYSLIDACAFAKEESKEQQGVEVIEIKSIERKEGDGDNEG